MDFADRASDYQAKHNAAALALHKNRMQSIDGIKGLTHCIDCGKEIPLQRRSAVNNCMRCRECQHRFEKGKHE